MSKCPGKDQYIKWDFFTGDEPTSSCGSCIPIWDPEKSDDVRLRESDASIELIESHIKDQSKKGGSNRVYGELLENYEQCANYADQYTAITSKSAKLAKLAANEAKVIVDDGSWAFLGDYKTERFEDICDPKRGDIKGEDKRLCRILNYYIQTDTYITDQDKHGTNNLSREIERQFGISKDVKTSGEIEYTLPPLPAKLGSLGGKKTMDDYKTAIHNNGGSNLSKQMRNYINTKRQKTPNKNILGKPTKEKIIQEEIYDFWITLNRKKDGAGEIIDRMSLEQIFADDPSSIEFELCMNNMFDNKLHGKGYDTKIQEQISNHNDISQLTDREIDYIEDKLKVIATLEEDDAMECMNILNIGEMICDKGVSDRMLKMGYLVFHIIGLDKMKLDTIERGSKHYQHLKKILDRLTPYIRTAVQKVIKISKYYELQTCGYESVSTHILETIYNDVFEKTKEVDVTIQGLDLVPTYLIKDTNMMEFARTIILLIVMIAGIYVLLMVLNRPA
jgi:hypothetical protein